MPPQGQPQKIPKNIKFGYGLGHVINDLTASLWFTYLLLFFSKVLLFDNTYSGIILLVGQIFDGLSTLFVGIFSDKGDNFWLCRKFGQRKSWHLFGLICTVTTFPFIFSRCIGCNDSDQSAQLIYYSGFVVIFQFGWACIQISHLSMIPELAKASDQRSGLTAVRNAAAVLSNITVFLVAWIFIGMSDGDDDDGKIGPSNDTDFRNISLVCLAIGMVTAVVFHFMVPSVQSPNQISSQLEEDVESFSGQTSSIEEADGLDALIHQTGETTSAISDHQKMTYLDWFSMPQLYQIGIIYLSTRLYVNLTQAYIPLFLQTTLQLEATSVATIPLAMFLSGFVTSVGLERAKIYMARKVMFAIGCIFGFAGCLWIYLGCGVNICDRDSSFATGQTYGVAVCIGAATSTLLVASLSLTADLIGPNTECSAFIYGFMSLTDKVGNGVAVVVIQHLIPNLPVHSPEVRNYFTGVLTWGSGASILLGFVCILTMAKVKVDHRRPVATSTSLSVNTDVNDRTPLLVNS